MLITLVDDSLPFNGLTPAQEPLGGAEKAFASLPGALARAGHDVRVYNRTRFPLSVEGADWVPMGEADRHPTDLLIAFRKPALLGFLPEAEHRALWWHAPASLLERPATRDLLMSYMPMVVFHGAAHRGAWRAPDEVGAAVIPPGVRADYLADAAGAPASPPRAIVTTHPLQGLDRILALWTETIRPRCPDAELHCYSASLSAALITGDAPPELVPVFHQAKAAMAQGLKVMAPLGDAGMAAAYRAARVHLYPGHDEDFACTTLMESQACGCPAVAYRRGGAPERIGDGESGYLVPDQEAFANLAVLLLSNEETFRSLSAGARLHQRARSWDMAAQDWLAVAG
jgi:glycosyltransferase involved in cell wall biosynthesis